MNVWEKMQKTSGNCGQFYPPSLRIQILLFYPMMVTLLFMGGLGNDALSNHFPNQLRYNMGPQDEGLLGLFRGGKTLEENCPHTNLKLEP